ncbi:MAG: glycerophosphodiester phosphodiesterase, partial [Methanosarcinales archaeon]|nr:glycerophosphodiester phosphodiesterase [Methanosarcinales archaeon]
SPENTLQGIATARRCRADAVEVDVRLAGDQTLVLMHDETVDRTTNGTGLVQDLSPRILHELDAGGEGVPTLKEAVELARSLGIRMVVEMKEEGIEDLVAEALKGEDALVTSFYHQSLLELKDLSDLRTGIIISALPVRPVELALAARADAIFPRRTNARLFKRAHGQGLEVYPWTINTPQQADWVLKLGADGVVTDDPCLLRDVLDQPAKDTSQENCEYYPCHFPGQVCTHCFCPLYPCRDPELGRFVRTRRGRRVWTCIDCDLVHIPEVARYLEDNPDATTGELKALVPGRKKSQGAK